MMSGAVTNPVFDIALADMGMEAVLDVGFRGIQGSGNSGMHSHSYFELMLCTGSGFSLELAKGALLPMAEGTVCLIPPGTFHRVLGNDQKLAIRFLCREAFSGGNLYPAFVASTAQLAQVLPLGKQPELIALTRQLSRELQEERLGKEPCIQSLLTQLFILLLRLLCDYAPAQGAIAESTRITAARRLVIEDFFYQHYQEDITEDALAGQLHLSKRQLSRVLQQLYGMSFRQMLVDIRLNHAARLLRDTQMSTEQITAAVGYNSLSGFYDAFRKKFGVSAGSYRKNN